MGIAFGIVWFAVILVLNIGQFLSLEFWPGFAPRRGGRHAAFVPPLEVSWDPQAPPSRVARAAVWFRWWRNCPRPPLGPDDWSPNRGFLFFPTALGCALTFGGVEGLFGARPIVRLAGLLALVGGLPSLTLIVLYVLRPADRNIKRLSRASP